MAEFFDETVDSGALPWSEGMRDVTVRRLGSGAIHRAQVPHEIVYPALVFGSGCELVEPPVIALCGATLWGDIVIMREYRTLCRHCKRMAT